jgi:tripartite-type tricarboxylate transporter receptor subunit TctC
MKRRNLLLGAASMVAAGRTFAQDKSMELVKVVHGFPVGGTADVTARRMSEKLRGPYANTVVVDSRTGAGGRIAIDFVTSSPPDGSTLLTAPMSTMAIYPHVFKNIKYDPFKDLVPVSLAATFALALAVGPLVPASVTNVKELLAWMKKTPGAAVYGSPSAGTSPHFLGAQISQVSGVELLHIPYRGSVPGVLELMGGQIPLMITSLGDFLPQMASGKIRILATSEATRSRFAPDVPTLAESGFPAIKVTEWIGFFAPAKTPPQIVASASAALRAGGISKDIREGMGLFGLEAKASAPEELAKQMRADFDAWAPIIKATGFTAES